MTGKRSAHGSGSQAPIPAPPRAEARPVTLSAHGLSWVDDYTWIRADNWREVLRDPSRLPADIRAAVDVLADGSISRVAVQRSDFRRLVARGGAQALIDSLNQKTADLSGGAGFGVDHHGVVHDGLEHCCKRSRDHVGSTTGRKRIDDGNCPIRIGFLRRRRLNDACSESAEHQTASIQAVTSLTTLLRTG